jgi:hypothetical protein
MFDIEPNNLREAQRSLKLSGFRRDKKTKFEAITLQEAPHGMDKAGRRFHMTAHRAKLARSPALCG